MELLTSQKDSLFKVIENIELSPSQFNFFERMSSLNEWENAVVIGYNSSKYYYAFDYYDNNHYAEMCPGRDVYSEAFFTKTWDNQIQYFIIWLQNLKREIYAPDFWSRLQNEINGLDFHFESDNEKFTFQEYEDVTNRIEILRSRLSSISFEENQLLALNQKLDFLIESAKDMKKFDWKGLFIGIIINVVMQLSVTPDNANSLWKIIKEVFSAYFIEQK